MVDQSKKFTELNWPVILLGAILILLAIIVRFVFLEAPIQSDDTMYFQAAGKYSINFLQNIDHHIYLRTGLLVPLMLFIKAFGYSIYTYYLFSLSIFILVLIAVYFFSCYYLNLFMASITVLLLGTSSLFLYQTSNVLPDLLCVLFMLLSYLVFATSLKQEKRRYLLIILASFLGFMVYLIRIPNIVFFLCLPLYEILETKSIRKSLLYLLFFISFIFIEEMILSWITGQFFVRFAVVNTNVENWASQIPRVDLGTYLLGPIKNIIDTITGKVLFFGGIIGFILACFKRNWPLVAFFAGGLLIFLIYSYSFSSLDPLKRALPLQKRYILCFTVALALSLAYLLLILVNIWNRQIGLARSSLVKVLIIFIIALAQVFELPREIKGAIFWGNDSYFVADRVLKDRLFSQPSAYYGPSNKILYIDGPVFSFPKRDFSLYPNFSRLQLQEMRLPFRPKPGQVVLYSKHRLKKNDFGLRNLESFDKKENIDFFLTDHPNWDYIINGSDIVLAKIQAKDFNWQKVYDLANISEQEKLWTSNLDSKIDIKDSGIDFLIPKTKNKTLYLYTFGSFSRPPSGYEPYFQDIHTKEWLRFEFAYDLNTELDSLDVFFVEYNQKARVCSYSYKLSPDRRKNRLVKNIRLQPETKSYRIYIRIESEVENRLSLNQFRFLFLQQ